MWAAIMASNNNCISSKAISLRCSLASSSCSGVGLSANGIMTRNRSKRPCPWSILYNYDLGSVLKLGGSKEAEWCVSFISRMFSVAKW